MPPIIVRTLSREYRLHAEAAADRDALRFMEIAPEIRGPALETIDLHVQPEHGYLAIELPGGILVKGSPNHLLSTLHRMIYADVLESEPGAPLVHGATVLIEGRRCLLVGRKGCGKTTLALHLAARGLAVEGDEHLVVGETGVIARPRTLRVKSGSLGLVAGLPASVWEAPSIPAWDGSLIRALSPNLAGQAWTIEEGQLDRIVFLSSNHGGRSVARPVGRNAAFGGLMAQTLMPANRIAVAAARLRRLAAETPVFEMSLGDLDGAEWHLKAIARA